MRGKAVRWWRASAVSVIVLAATGLLYEVWRSPHQAELAAYGAFALPVATAAIAGAKIAWSRKAGSGTDSANAIQLDLITDQFADVLTVQWSHEADRRGLRIPEPIPIVWRRSSLPLAPPAEAAARTRRFEPLPGLSIIDEQQLAMGQISGLHAVYGGLGSGRLLIAGRTGSGKSGTAVLLVLAALEYRRKSADTERSQIPVPVLLTADEWSPGSQSIDEWLVLRLQKTYPIFTGDAGARKAAELIAAGKLSLFLDGLDEMPAGSRPIALQALNRQATFRLVVLTRTAEMAYAASQRGVLEGAAAIELQNVNPASTADYLTRIQVDPLPDGWRRLVDHIRQEPGSALTKALDSPLTITLIRDTYRMENEGVKVIYLRDDASELLDFYAFARKTFSGDQLTEEIVDHLLDRVLPAAYTPRPGERRPVYKLHTAQRALASIAAQLNSSKTRELDLLMLPQWTSELPRCVVAGLFAALIDAVMAGVTTGFMTGSAIASTTGIAVGIISGIKAGVFYWLGTIEYAERDSVHWIARSWLVVYRSERAWLIIAIRSSLDSGFAAGITAWVVLGIVFGPIGGLLRALVVGLVIGVVTGIETGGSFNFTLKTRAATANHGGSLSPLTYWRSSRRSALAFSLLSLIFCAGVFGIASGAMFGLWSGIRTGIIVATASAAETGLIIWSSWFTFVELARRWHTPVRLLRFLNDAQERGVLRTEGSLYQFRHARLQDRLAKQK